jgi:hypothetical protein
MLAATLYRIEGLPSSYRLRVLKPRERIPEDNRRPIRLQKWADYLWRDVLKCPVYSTGRFEQPAFLIPDAYTPDHSIEIRGVPDTVYHLDVGETIEIPIPDATEEEKELICRMIERVITDRLLSLGDTLWKEEWTLFFLQKAENYLNKQDEINAFRGCKFGAVFVHGIPYLALDIQTKYYGRRPLAQFNTQEREEILSEHLDLGLPSGDRGTFVIDNVRTKTPGTYAGQTGKNIAEQRIENLDMTIIQYYEKKFPELVLDSHDKAAYVQPRGQEDRTIVSPESRLFPVFGSDSEMAKRCSVRPQITPRDRLILNGKFLSLMSGIRYQGSSLRISSKPMLNERTAFLPPTLEFGSGKTLSAFPGGVPDKSSIELDKALSNFGPRKIAFLHEGSPFHNELIPSLVLLYPQSLNRETRERFIEALGNEVFLISGQKLAVAGQVQYGIGERERLGSSLLRNATEVGKNYPNSAVVVILWDRLNKTVHSELKQFLRPLRSQCAWERTVKEICYGSSNRRISKLRNLSLALTTEVGMKPWVLHDSLHHDLHIGIDVLFGQICYNYLYGMGGRQMMTQTGRAITRGHMHEAIKKSELEKQLVTDVRKIVQEGFKVESVVVHRDGMWFPSERKGFELAFSRLRQEKVLSESARCCVVEIHKTHKPIRLFSVSENASDYRNPVPGTYLMLDSNRVIINTTGRPGEWDVPYGRTARTILLRVVQKIGSFDVVNIAEDAYRLTHLNWSSPDIAISLPVTIRWSDDSLRETLLPAEEDEDQADKKPDDDVQSDYEYDASEGEG